MFSQLSVRPQGGGEVEHLWCQIPSWSLFPCPFFGAGYLCSHVFFQGIGYLWSHVPCSRVGYTLPPPPCPPPRHGSEILYPLEGTWDKKHPTHPPTPRITKAGGTHPTGMFSCFYFNVRYELNCSIFRCRSAIRITAFLNYILVARRLCNSQNCLLTTRVLLLK